MEEQVKIGVDGQEEQVVSEESLVLKKRQMDFEKKQASGELELEEKKKGQPEWVQWVIIALVILGLAAMTYFMGLI